MRKIVINALALSIIFMLLSYTITYADDEYDYNRGEELYNKCIVSLNLNASFSDAALVPEFTYNLQDVVTTMMGYNRFDRDRVFMYTELVGLKYLEIPVYDKKIGIEEFAQKLAEYTVDHERMIIQKVCIYVDSVLTVDI